MYVKGETHHMIIRVTEKELEGFLPLIPADMQEPVRDEEWFCLGALFEAEGGDGESIPAGVIIFSPEEGIAGDGEASVLLQIKWLFVAGQYRRKGIANDLMQELSDVLSDNPAEGIICDIPFDSGYDLLEAFFVSWGFDFEVIDKAEMVITKEDFKRKIESMDKEERISASEAFTKPDGVHSIMDIPQELFAEAVQKAKASESFGYYDLISEDREDYAGDVSFVTIRDDKVSSLILFERLNGGNLHVVMLAGLSQKDTKEIFDLLHYAAGYYYLNYPENAKVVVTLGNERSRKLAAHIFPNKDPMMIRRGYFY